MFFPEKIVSINEKDRVLEIGPGALPFSRANVYLDKEFDAAEEKLAQFGNAERTKELENLIYYQGNIFPFKDHEFDYVVCSHVIEHIDRNDLDIFLSEITRVASKGYIEVPNVFYEFICNTHVHKWLIGKDGNTLTFFPKENIQNNKILDTFRAMFYNCDNELEYNIFSRYKEAFFIGYEWNDNIEYKIVNNIDHLFGEDEFNYFNGKIKKSPSHEEIRPSLERLMELYKNRPLSSKELYALNKNYLKRKIYKLFKSRYK